MFEPLYSRSSIMTFVLTEVLLQALTLMNSPQQRGRRAHAETPRRLRRIVLTLPTGMPLAERLIFRKRAEAARDLVWMMMGWKLDDAAAPAPRVLTEWDEASCTQLVYLYTEVARNFGGDARRFFQVAGKQRGKPADGTLTIASIDVGGGTTDLIINNYRLEGAGTSVTLFPEQKFREGFNVAGDDILLRVVQGHVLPPIEAALRAARHRQPGRPDGRAGGRRPRRRGRDPAQPAPAVRAADRPADRARAPARRRDLRPDLGRRWRPSRAPTTRSSRAAPSRRRKS